MKTARNFPGLVVGAMSVAMALALMFPQVAVAGDTAWLHVLVDEKGEDGDRVRINLPLNLVESILPLIEEEGFSGGCVSIDSDHLSAEDLREIWSSVREAEGGEYIRVEGVDEDVSVKREGDYLTVEVREDEDGSTTDVSIRIHLSIVDALLSGEGEKLDILAAIKALGENARGDLVVVNEEDESVRIWVDDKNTAD